MPNSVKVWFRRVFFWRGVCSDKCTITFFSVGSRVAYSSIYHMESQPKCKKNLPNVVKKTEYCFGWYLHMVNAICWCELFFPGGPKPTVIICVLAHIKHSQKVPPLLGPHFPSPGCLPRSARIEMLSVISIKNRIPSFLVFMWNPVDDFCVVFLVSFFFPSFFVLFYYFS